MYVLHNISLFFILAFTTNFHMYEITRVELQCLQMNIVSSYTRQKELFVV